MDTVNTLRELWRLRLLVGGVCVVALLAGLAILYEPSFPPKSRQYDVGVATTSILLDTPNSQVVAVAPRGSDTLGLRANLLASLMVDGVVKTAIARAAGLNPNDLVGVSTSVTDQPVNGPKNPRAPVLTTQVVTDNSSNPLPIIEVTAQAGNAAAAGRLANAAVVGLREYLDSTAATEGIAAAQRLQVSGLSVPQGQTATRGPSDILAFLAVILVVVLGCAGILGVRALMRGWNAAAVRERLGGGELLAPEIAPTPDEFEHDGVIWSPGGSFIRPDLSPVRGRLFETPRVLAGARRIGIENGSARADQARPGSGATVDPSVGSAPWDASPAGDVGLGAADEALTGE